MTTAIIFANEVPDFGEDKLSGKRNLVSIVGPQRAYLVYSALIVAGFISITLATYRGYLGFVSLLAFVFVFPAMLAAKILKQHYTDKVSMLKSSALAIGIQIFVSLVLILDRLL